MYKDTHVYCTLCKWFRLDDEVTPYCPYSDECDLWDCEDSKPYSERPKYEMREEIIRGHRMTYLESNIFHGWQGLSIVNEAALNEVLKEFISKKKEEYNEGNDKQDR